jgi:hypothetical protein
MTMQALQKKLNDSQRDKEQDSRQARENGKELMLLRKHCKRLENEGALA